jgi:hypothetical protein
MNAVLARRRVTIRRIFLITPNDYEGENRGVLQSILDAQKNVLDALVDSTSEDKINIRDRRIEAKGFFVGCLDVDEDKLSLGLGLGRQTGLFKIGKATAALSIQRNREGHFSRIQLSDISTHKSQIAEMRKAFADSLRTCTSIFDYKIPAESPLPEKPETTMTQGSPDTLDIERADRIDTNSDKETSFF